MAKQKNALHDYAAALSFEDDNDRELFTYNAMAHPQYDRDGMLLVSYCVNSKRPRDIWEDASIYRPRFLRVPYDLILN